MEKDLSNKIYFINYEPKPMYEYVKRSLDIILSLLGIFFLLPFFLCIALFIKIDDKKGSILYSQSRIGKEQKKFKMYKFRSMYSNAEERLEELLKYNEVDGAMFKMKDDPRITRIGKFLRKYSIDELPQLFNVLKGDMSLVGPRPPLTREVNMYTNFDKQRLIIKPGITGLWQVSGRSSLSFEQMVDLDLQYIQSQSIITDIKILIKTVSIVFINEDAY